MDASKDSMEDATFMYLMHGSIHGSPSLTPTHMCDLINKYVGIAKRHLRNVSLPSISSQVTLIGSSQLLEDFKSQKALKVYSIGAEPWTDVVLVEHWFVDRDGRWYWVKCNTQGDRADCSTVTVQHLVDRRTSEGQVPVRVLSEICEAFRRKFIDASVRAQVLSADLTDAAAALARGASATSFIPPSTP